MYHSEISMATNVVNQPSLLPPYPKLILEAIEALGENGGNTKKISNYIKSTYGELLPEHSTILTTCINKMKVSGEIVFFKNNFFKPSPNAPPKRGRGRPSKPKVPFLPNTISSPPRFRGCPRKNVNAQTKPPISNVSSGSGKPRGRPKKIVKTEVTTALTSTKRPRGRPKKIVNVGVTSSASSTKRPRVGLLR